MRRPPIPPSSAGGAGERAAGTHLRGSRLLAARAAAVCGTAFGVGDFAARLPGHIHDVRGICTGAVCPYAQLDPAAVRAFAAFGLSLGGYAVLHIGLTVVAALLWFALAAVLAWRRSDDWLARVVAVVEETMRPAYASLWLAAPRPAVVKGAERAEGGADGD